MASAVCWEYRTKITKVILGLPNDRTAQRFALNIAVAFLPLAVLGLLFKKRLNSISSPVPVALAFIVGAFFILWAERREHQVQIDSVDELTVADAFKLGLAQTLALSFPAHRARVQQSSVGCFSACRRAAAEFSFSGHPDADRRNGLPTLQGTCPALPGRYWPMDRRFRLRLCLRVSLRTLATAIHLQSRLHPVRVWYHRFGIIVLLALGSLTSSRTA